MDLKNLASSVTQSNLGRIMERLFQGRDTEVRERKPWRQKRHEPRFGQSERMLAQIRNSEEAALIGQSMSCQTVDVSKAGFRMQSPQGIPTGSQLDVWLELKGQSGRYFLASEVCWCQRMARDVFEIGVRLVEADSTDLETWRSTSFSHSS